jgi:putative ABC transport system permease protein
MQLLKYSADDASCLNLNKVITPNVLGVDMDELATRFGCTKIVSDPSAVYPALIDQTVLTWSLGKKLGDVIFYPGEKGDTIAIQLSGTIQNSIFQGYILIDKGFFSEIWSEISGSEILLVTVPDKEVANTKILLSQALNNYGIRVMTTGERLKMFYSVINTYLTIFLTLGGLGLLIGIFSFIIVVRKNIVARTTEVILYHSLGFDQKRIINLLYKENIIVPLAALFTGAFGSFIGVSFGLGNVGITIWILATLFLVLFFLCVLLFVKHSVNHSVNHFVNLSVNRFVDYSANRFVDHSENHS